MKQIYTLLFVLIMVGFSAELTSAARTPAVSATANFQSDLNLISTETSVNYIDNSSGNPIAWLWTFTGGTPASYSGKVPPPVYYNTAGEYDVSLQVTDALGVTSTETKPDFIDVHNYPASWQANQNASSHLISISSNVTFGSNAMQYGDFLGVFYLDENSNEQCGGFTIWDGTNNKVVVAFGNDVTTDPIKDGFIPDEEFSWKVFFSQSSSEQDAEVDYNLAMLNDSTFVENGLSALSNITAGTADPLTVVANADPSLICAGAAVQLDALASEGTGTYSYSWISDPVGFTSSIKNPLVYPTTSTTYTVVADDGITTASDDVSVTVNLNPVADAGANATLCEGETYTLNNATAGNFSSVQWSGGLGSYDNSSTVNSQYTPALSEAGTSVQLCILVQPINPCTSFVSDCMNLFVSKKPLVFAGDDATICQGDTYTMSASAQNFSSLLWNGGSGSFDNSSILTATYTPAVSEYGSIISLFIYAAPISPCSTIAIDTLNLTILENPTANAGANATICVNGTHTLNGASASNYDALSWSGGAGSYNNNGLLYPTYTPIPLEAGTTVVLCLAASPINPCTVSTSDCKNLFIQALPTVDAGPNATTCANQSYPISGASAANNTTAFWLNGGSGTFENGNAVNATYFPGENESGTITHTLIVSAISPCNANIMDGMQLTIQKLPTAFAGDDAAITIGEDYINPDATATNFSSLLWTSTGDGAFDDATILNPTYTPGDNDKSNGTASLCLEALPISPCQVSVSDSLVLSIGSRPTVYAGADISLCEESQYQLIEAFAENYSSLTWSGNGDGTFDDPSLENPVYYMGTQDLSDGTVELCLTAQPILPATTPANDCMTLTIVNAPTAYVGADIIACANEIIVLQGESENACGFQWASSGDGVFDAPFALNPVYTPGNGDIVSGGAELCMTAMACEPCFVNANDCLILTLNEPPTANAGINATICENKTLSIAGSVDNSCGFYWETSGDGSFADAASLQTVYYPGFSDLINGGTQICLVALACDPCATPATDCLVLTIQGLPTPNAGANASICIGEDYTLNGSLNNAGGFFWQTTGDGSFAPSGILTPTYYPGIADENNGSVSLTLFAFPKAPCISFQTSSMTLSLVSNPSADAGDDIFVCDEGATVLNPVIEDACGVVWESDGDGIFDNPNLPNATYYPGEGDLTGGIVELCITALPCGNCDPPAQDCLTITYLPAPTVNAGEDIVACENDEITLNALATNYCDVQWSSNGDGAFVDAGDLNTTYLPGVDDLLFGGAELTVTVMGCEPCTNSVSDDLNLSFAPLPLANAGADATVCGQEILFLNGFVANACGFFWTTTGDGAFGDEASLSSTYLPSAADVLNGSVSLCLTAMPCQPCTVAAESCITLTFAPSPVANAGANVTICEDGSLTLDGQAENSCATLWTTTGDGNFDDVSSLLAVYTPGENDRANGSVELCLTADACQPCTVADESCIVLTFAPSPVANAGANATICEDGSLTLDGQAENSCATLWTTTGDGNFDDASSLQAVYTPGENDRANGSVELCLTADACQPCTVADESCIVLTFAPSPVADAGANATICASQSYLLDGNSTNAASILWTSSGDGIFNNPQLTDATYTPGASDANNGTVILSLTAYPLNPCTTEVTDTMTLTLNHCQTMVIAAGWSGISSWVDPFDTQLETLFAPIMDELIILQTMQDSWWPAQNMNTIGAYNSQQGYKIKVTGEVEITIPGTLPESPAITLNPGWNLIPVLSSCNVDVASLFAGTDVVMVKEVAGWKLYWPDLNINNLIELQTGKSYYIFMDNAATVSFPECDPLKSVVPNVGKTYDDFYLPLRWIDFVPGSSSHVVAIPAPVIGFENLAIGDLVGLCDVSGACFGMAEWTGSNISILAFADDPTTSAKDGFAEDEIMQLVHYSLTHNSFTTMDVVYDESYPAHDGTYLDQGISVVKSSQANTINNYTQANVKLYPNPVKQTLMIQMDDNRNAKIEVLNMEGQVVYKGNLVSQQSQIDFSAYSIGVYLVRISGNGINHIERITKH